MKHPSIVKWAILVTGASLLLAIVYAVWSGISKAHLRNDSAFCAAVEGDTALARARARAQCIEDRADPLEKLYFHPTYTLVNSLYDNDCKYVGVWTRSVAGVVYRYVMDDAGNYTVTRSDNRVGTTPVGAGTWVYWHGNFVWLSNDGKPWPPEVMPIISDTPGQIILRERDGSATPFQRINTIESRVCATKGIPNPNLPVDQVETQDDMTPLLEKAQTAPAVADFAGSYASEGMFVQDTTLQLVLGKDGSVKGSMRCNEDDGAISKQESGTLNTVHDWYELGAVSINAVDTCRLPSRFFPLMMDGQHYLLSDAALVYLVNQLNAGQAVDTSLLLHQGETDRKAAWLLAKLPTLPKPYAQGLLKTPISAHVSGIGGVGATSPAELLHAPTNGVEYGTNASLDVGSRLGVFEGMALHARGAPDSLHIVVTNVLIDSASVRMTWRGDWRPGAMLDVSTHP